MVGLALVSFVSILAAGTKASINQAIDSSFAGNLIIENSSQAGNVGIPTEIPAALAGVPGVRQVTPIAFTEGRVKGLSGTQTITALDPVGFANVYRIDWDTGSDATLAGARHDRHGPDADIRQRAPLPRRRAALRADSVGPADPAARARHRNRQRPAAGAADDHARARPQRVLPARRRARLRELRERRDRRPGPARGRPGAGGEVPADQVADRGAVQGLARRPGQQPAGVHLRAAGAVGDRVAVRDRQHARAVDLRAHARARDAARDRHDAQPGARDDPHRVGHHGPDRRRARDRARHRARGRPRRDRAVRHRLRAGRARRRR